jgi:hypothetical protein
MSPSARKRNGGGAGVEGIDEMPPAQNRLERGAGRRIALDQSSGEA